MLFAADAPPRRAMMMITLFDAADDAAALSAYACHFRCFSRYARCHFYAAADDLLMLPPL